jgi:4-hydroxy-2-oxoheptanedioate aldolase
MPAAELKRRWSEGEATYASVIRLGSPWVAEVFAKSGLDVVWIDEQHGFNPEHLLVSLLQAMNGTNATPIVRVQANDPAAIGRVLDAGAEGVIVPMVESVGDAEAAVAATRYGPVGNRSHGGLRLKFLPGGVQRETICIVMVETVAGLEQVEKIAAVDGVDGMFIGPNDLSLSLGLPPRDGINAGPQGDAIMRIKRACDEHGKVCGITGDAQDMRELGFRLISIGGDSIFMLDAMERALARR